MAGKACCMLTPELFLSHRLLDGIWLLANENGTLKLHPSWLVKSFTKGLGFFNRVAKIAEWEGIYIISNSSHILCDPFEKRFGKRKMR